jgi:hypothetical protein
MTDNPLALPGAIHVIWFDSTSPGATFGVATWVKMGASLRRLMRIEAWLF